MLGDVPPKVAAELFGIFPHWLFESSCRRRRRRWTHPPRSAPTRSHRPGGHASAFRPYRSPAALAELLFRVVDAADASGLALFAGWKNAERPDGDVERLGFALMVFRELRGGLHFAALRAVGLSVPEAVIADPEGGRGRLLRTAWPEEAADELAPAAERKPDLRDRWHRAEALTDDRIGELLVSALSRAGAGRVR